MPPGKRSALELGTLSVATGRPPKTRPLRLRATGEDTVDPTAHSRRAVQTACAGFAGGPGSSRRVASWPARRVPGGGQGPEELRVMASSCSRENSPGRARRPGLSSGLGGGGGGVPSPQPARRGQRGPGGALPPTADGGQRAPPSLTSAAGLEEARALGTSRRLLRGACRNRHTLPGDKAPGWQGRGRDTGPPRQRSAAEPETPRPLPPDPAGPPSPPETSLASLPSRAGFLELTPSWVCYFYPP